MMHTRLGLATTWDDQKRFYEVTRIADQALVERLPSNEFVQLNDNMMALTFEVVETVTNISHVPRAGPKWENALGMTGGLIVLLYLLGYVTVGMLAKAQRDMHLMHELYKTAPDTFGELNEISL